MSFSAALFLLAITLPSLWTPSRAAHPFPSQGAAAEPQPSSAQQPSPPQQRPATPALAANQTNPATSADTFDTIVLDPAHGGPDAGARGSSGAVESEVVMGFARAIRAALEAQGLRVVLTRDGNQDPSFDDRSALANGLHDSVFISLHVSSTGPPGTARVYFLRMPGSPTLALSEDLPASSRSGTQTTPATVASRSRSGLIAWDRAQLPRLASSRQLAELIQIQLAQKFNGSPEVPQDAAIFQLRSIASPAVAIEVSSVAVPDPQRLTQMAQPLAEAVARAVLDFRTANGAVPTAPRGAPSGGAAASGGH